MFLLKIRVKTEKNERYLLQFKTGGTVSKLCTYFWVFVWKELFGFNQLFFSVFSERHPLSEERRVAVIDRPLFALKEETLLKHLFKISSILSIKKDNLVLS